MTTLCTPFSCLAHAQHELTPNTPSRAKVFLWKLISNTIFPCLPSPLYKLRRIILRAFGATLDPHARIRGGVRISHPWNLTIGRKSSIGEGTLVFNPAPLMIGDRSVISQYCYVACITSDDYNPANPQYPSPLTIKDDVWIATECVIQGNQTIQNGVLVGARSFVDQDATEPWHICVGYPARPIKERKYPSRTIQTPSKTEGSQA